MNDEYERRIDLCSSAIRKATKKIGLICHFAENYQGMEVRIDTEVGTGEVIILMDTGHGPHFPKYITLTVHGVVDYDVNKNINIGGGGIESAEKKFLPDEISTKWLEDVISKATKSVKSICTAENMAKLKKEASAKRHLEIKESRFPLYQQTHLVVTSPPK